MAAPQPAAESGRFQRFAAWQAHRYGNLAVVPAAALLTVIGVGVLAAPGRYTSPFYTFVFALTPARVIGPVFVTVGVAALTHPNRPTVGALVAVNVGWSLAVLYASVVVGGVSPTAWAYPLLVTVTLFQCVSARTPPARRPPLRNRWRRPG